MMSAAPRLSLQYVLIFAATGASLPFAAVWLQGRGLDGSRIGLVLAAPLIARLITGPALAIWADGLKTRRKGVGLLALAAALGYALAALSDSFGGVAIGWFVGASASAALLPLVDTLNLRLARREGFSFSVPRGFGSAAFVCANLLVGGLIVATGSAVLILWVIAATFLAALAAWRVLPAEPASEGGPGLARVAGLGRLLRDPVLMTALMAIGLIQAAHAFYYGFSALIWERQGLPATTSGALWAFSVAVEIGFMWWAHPWLRRRGLGPRALLLVGAAAAIVRWSAFAAGPAAWALWPLQTLHALTFAATYLAGVELVERLSPSESHTVAQTLGSALSSGALIGLATLASGPLYDAFGHGGYWAMVVLAALGGVLGLRVSQKTPEQDSGLD